MSPSLYGNICRSPIAEQILADHAPAPRSERPCGDQRRHRHWSCRRRAPITPRFESCAPTSNCSDHCASQLDDYNLACRPWWCGLGPATICGCLRQPRRRGTNRIRRCAVISTQLGRPRPLRSRTLTLRRPHADFESFEPSSRPPCLPGTPVVDEHSERKRARLMRRLAVPAGGPGWIALAPGWSRVSTYCASWCSLRAAGKNTKLRENHNRIFPRYPPGCAKNLLPQAGFRAPSAQWRRVTAAGINCPPCRCWPLRVSRGIPSIRVLAPCVVDGGPDRPGRPLGSCDRAVSHVPADPASATGR